MSSTRGADKRGAYLSVLDYSVEDEENPRIDHLMTLDAARRICRGQNSKFGKEVGQYLAKMEDAWKLVGEVVAKTLNSMNEHDF